MKLLLVLCVVMFTRSADIIGNDDALINFIWVGLKDNNADGVFEYTDGAPIGNSNWKETPTADPTKVCVSRNDLGELPYWYATNCETLAYFICEADEVVLPCHAHWTYNPDAGTCVRAIRGTRRTYTGASSYCKSLGGELATKVTTLKERKRIMKLMKFQGHIFIGVDDKDNDGTYEYIDGAALGGLKPFRKGRSPAGRCVTLKRRRWYPKSCTRKFFFACEKAAMVK